MIYRRERRGKNEYTDRVEVETIYSRPANMRPREEPRNIDLPFRNLVRVDLKRERSPERKVNHLFIYDVVSSAGRLRPRETLLLLRAIS